MNPGELNKKFIIQKNANADKVNGSYEEDWQDYVTVWASIKPLRGRTLLMAQQINSTINVEVTMRYRNDITPSMRGMYQGQIYNFVGMPINVNMANKELLLYCEVIFNG